MNHYYVATYSGQFGFIKPWTAVRDSETFSQQFLTPSIVEGMEKKLFPELLATKGIHKILRHRLSYASIDVQQERTWSKGGFLVKKEKDRYKTNLAIINRGVMIDPLLHLAFAVEQDAQRAIKQHLCLCRNEDLLLPSSSLAYLSEAEFDQIDGFEMLFTEEETNAFKVGHNRYDGARDMFGQLKIFGNPIRQNAL